jgi:3-hydroxymyristoyl/3-hydroxydecanoyl-(acyl carrier protein) dehydratase
MNNLSDFEHLTKLDDNSITALLELKSDNKWIKGHFDELPILPGVAITYYVIELCKKFFDIDLDNAFLNFDLIKFAKPILLGTRAKFQISHVSEKSQITFSIYDVTRDVNSDEVLSSGKFKYEI